jgi:hypothetical protein
MIPSDGTVVIDGTAAFGVNFAGIDPTIHAIQWFGAMGEGNLEFIMTNPVTGEKPPNQIIYSIAPYQSYVDQAVAIINAAQNPDIYYSTTDSTTYQGNTYTLGQQIVVSTPNTPQPAGTTASIPPTPEDFQELYWFSGAWVISSFPPSLSLLQAQNYLVTAVKTSAASNVDNQARIYSPLQLAAAPDMGALPTADYSGLTLADYQANMDAEVSSAEVQINAATSPAQLYNFNPAIDPAP